MMMFRLGYRGDLREKRFEIRVRTTEKRGLSQRGEKNRES